MSQLQQLMRVAQSPSSSGGRVSGERRRQWRARLSTVAVAAAGFGGVLAGSLVGVLAGSGTAWADEAPVQLLAVAEPNDSGLLGGVVAIDGDVAVLGTDFRGTARIFVRCDGAWVDRLKVVGSNTVFASAVAVSGDTVALGNPVDGASGDVVVYTRDGAGLWSESTTVTSPNAVSGARFGSGVSMSGDTLAVGAPIDSVAGVTTGVVYVFTREVAGTWTQTARLSADDGAASDSFGSSVSLCGGTLVVGAPTRAGGGAAYFFRRDAGGAWTQEGAVTGDDTAADDDFGGAVAVSGDCALIGAERDDDVDDATGSAYVFARSEAGVWSQQQKLTASDGVVRDRFGHSVALAGGLALVGAAGDGNGPFAERAWVYRENASGAWVEQQLLTAPTGTFNGFGQGVALSGSTALVGVPYEDVGLDNSGAAYSFDLQAKRVASDARASARLGIVDISGDRAIAGAPGDGAGIGAAYIFERDACRTWREVVRLTAIDTGTQDEFGFSVAIAGSTAVVGAVGVDDAGPGAGAAYVFERNPAGQWTQQAKLIGSGVVAGSRFGGAVAATPDTLVVASQSVVAGFAGVHVFVRDQTGDWAEQARLVPDVALDLDGRSVAIDGDTILVGDLGFQRTGSVYVYVRDELGAWALRDLLLPGDDEVGNDFGCSVAIHGSVAVVGARRDAGVAANGGSAYVYVRGADGSWTQDAEISPMGVVKNDSFGQFVDIHQGTILVGALGFGDGDGAAYVFRRSVLGTWEQQRRITAVDVATTGAESSFGACALSGDTAVIAAFGDEEGGRTAGAAYFIDRLGYAHLPDLIGSSLGSTTVGVPYHAEVFATGERPLLFEMVDGALPAGLALDRRTGVVSGVATEPGAAQFTIQWSDPCGRTSRIGIGTQVAAAVEIGRSALPVAVVARPYFTRNATVGGEFPMTWSLVGDLPAELSSFTVDPRFGEIRGTPTVEGESILRLRVVDANGSADERDVTLRTTYLADLGARRLDEVVAFTSASLEPFVRPLDLVAGTRVDILVKFPGEGAQPVNVELLDGLESSIVLDAKQRRRKSSVEVTGIEVLSTGRHFLLIRPINPYDGEVRVRVKVTALQRVGGDATTVVGAARSTISFGVLGGAKVKLVAKRAKGSATVPRIGVVFDSLGRELAEGVDYVVREARNDKKLTLTLTASPEGGTIFVTLRDDGPLGGDVTWRTTIKQPKAYDFTVPDGAPPMAK